MRESSTWAATAIAFLRRCLPRRSDIGRNINYTKNLQNAKAQFPGAAWRVRVSIVALPGIEENHEGHKEHEDRLDQKRPRLPLSLSVSITALPARCGFVAFVFLVFLVVQPFIGRPAATFLSRTPHGGNPLEGSHPQSVVGYCSPRTGTRQTRSALEADGIVTNRRV